MSETNSDDDRKPAAVEDRELRDLEKGEGGGGGCVKLPPSASAQSNRARSVPPTPTRTEGTLESISVRSDPKNTYFVLFTLPMQRLTRHLWILPIMRNCILLHQIDQRVLILYQFTYISMLKERMRLLMTFKN